MGTNHVHDALKNQMFQKIGMLRVLADSVVETIDAESLVVSNHNILRTSTFFSPSICCQLFFLELTPSPKPIGRIDLRLRSAGECEWRVVLFFGHVLQASSDGDDQEAMQHFRGMQENIFNGWHGEARCASADHQRHCRNNCNETQ